MPVFRKDVRYNGQQQQKYYWLGRITCVSIVHRAYGIYTIWGSCLQYAHKQQKLQFLCWTMCSASWVLDDEYCMVLLYVRKCALSMKTWDTMLNVVWYCKYQLHIHREVNEWDICHVLSQLQLHKEMYTYVCVSVNGILYMSRSPQTWREWHSVSL